MIRIVADSCIADLFGFFAMLSVPHCTNKCKVPKVADFAIVALATTAEKVECQFYILFLDYSYSKFSGSLFKLF